MVLSEIVSTWIAPVITSLIAAILAARLFPSSKEEANSLADESRKRPEADVSHETLPLTKKYNSSLPIGYYALSPSLAKRMEPDFYRFLKKYSSRILPFWTISIFFFVFSLFQVHDDEMFAGLCLAAFVNSIVLFPRA